MGNLLGKEEPIDFNGEVDLHWFNLLRCVGKGAFGKVRIVERRDTKKIFALKYINKIQCIKMKAVHNILRERALLEELQHPFLVNLRYAFQDDENMFMVIDLMMGGDLRFHLDRTGGFTEAMIRYYAAELATVLSYMHKRRIVHRDLKPDNLLLDDRGHCHITDFNIASRFEENKVLKSHSGTLAYMAPEVFESNGYTWTVDWWSLGATLYECLYGRRPFHGSTNEELTVNIRSKHLDFPTYNLVTKQPLQVSKDCISFLQALLERDPKKRIGCTSGRGNLDDVMAHPWFAAVDFERLTRKEYQPPFVPDANHANFDAMYDLEELLLEENPLTHRPRKKKAEQKPTETGTSSAGAVGGPHKTATVTPSAIAASPEGSPTEPTCEDALKKKKSRTEQELEFIDKNFAIFDYRKTERFKDEIAAEDLATMNAASNSRESSRRTSKTSQQQPKAPTPPPILSIPMPPLSTDLYIGQPGTTAPPPTFHPLQSVGAGGRRLGRDSEAHNEDHRSAPAQHAARSASMSDRGPAPKKSEIEKPRARSAASAGPHLPSGETGSGRRKRSISRVFGGVRLFKRGKDREPKDSDWTTVVSSRPVNSPTPDM